MNLVWLPAARRDFETIIRYIAERDVAAAQRLKSLIADGAERLAEHPFMYRTGRVPGHTRGGRAPELYPDLSCDRRGGGDHQPRPCAAGISLIVEMNGGELLGSIMVPAEGSFHSRTPNGRGVIRAEDAGSASTRQSGGLTERSTGSLSIPQEAVSAALRVSDG